MAPKAAIFDLDGLLVNTEVVSLRIYQDMLAPYGHGLTRNEYAELYSGRTERHNVESIIGRYDLPITVDEGLRQVADLERGYLERGVDLMPGARELLAWLSQRDVKIALASANTPERALSLLSRNGVRDHFGHFAYSSECERGKPAPDVFLLAAERCGADPAECVAFEDSEAGVIAVSVKDFFLRKVSTFPHPSVSSFSCPSVGTSFCLSVSTFFSPVVTRTFPAPLSQGRYGSPLLVSPCGRTAPGA